MNFLCKTRMYFTLGPEKLSGRGKVGLYIHSLMSDMPVPVPVEKRSLRNLGETDEVAHHLGQHD